MSQTGTLDAEGAHSTILKAATHAGGTCSAHPTGPLLRPGETTTHHEVAVEICRVFEYQITNIKGLKVSSLFFLMPLGLAWSILEQDSLYTGWITEMLASTPITKGYTIRGNSLGFGLYEIPGHVNDVTLLKHSEERSGKLGTEWSPMIG